MSAPILLLGCNGQLGFELQHALSPLGPVVALDRRACDLAATPALRRRMDELIARHRPDILVNAGAYTAVDRAESEPEQAEAVNARAPGVLGEAAARHGMLVVHYSTDYVFDGQNAAPYRESDAPNPLNVYGKSKLAGERALQASGAKHLIFRTSWVFSAHGGNFIKTMLRLAAEREKLNVVADQHGAPTSANLLANTTALILYRYLQALRDETADAFPYGLYHLTASGATTWLDYANRIFAAARAANRPLKLGKNGLCAIQTRDYPLPATRPANSRLDCSRARDTFKICLPPWQEGVDRVLRQVFTLS
jgi:dTDP-4-dehydrorhamnose reductase